MHPATPRRATPALACLCAAGSIAHAQGVANDAELNPIVITGTRPALPANLPNSTAGKSADELRGQNVFNPEDALQYLPDTTVRKRYIGDRNALIAGRDFGNLQPSRALVYLDGYLISNFLGRFDAPRWNMISPEAISRVDVLYGPFSALYPGNSIGTTVTVTQSVPKGFEASGRVIGYQQRFDQYGHSDRYDGNQFSLHVGSRLDSGLWFTADVNHENSTSQPMQYYTVSANAAGAFPATTGTATPVTGIVYDTDPKGLKRAVFGASGGAIDHTVQDTLNLRAGYRFTPTLEAGGMASWWTNHTRNTNDTWLRDAAGSAVWSGNVTDGTNTFNIPAAAFAPSTREEFHQQLGFTLKTRHDAGWNGSVVLSDYRIRGDEARQANLPEPTAATGGAGSVTRRDGTGWDTFELQTTWTPRDGDWMGGRHALAFGRHRNTYRLDSTVANASDWRGAEDPAPSQYYRGRTEVTALYAQDAWRLRDDLKLTLGLREEAFRAFDGSQLGAGTVVNYAGRSLRGHSPKAALAWNATDDLLLKASFGRGVRFPNVEELYNGTVTATSQTLSDPNLKPEVSDALELSAEKEWGRHALRVSLFHNDVHDAILRQTDATVIPNKTYVSNVDRVKTTGIEFAWSAKNWPIKTLSLDASATFTRSKVAENAKDPQSVGKWWLRVPRTRAKLLTTWRPDDRWMASIGWRHEGRAWNDTYNLDIDPNVFGAVSPLNQIDLRLSYKVSKQLELAAGIDNATDARAYQFHPLPGRTLFAELRLQR